MEKHNALMWAWGLILFFMYAYLFYFLIVNSGI
jgi:hypothetical protein